MNAQLPLILYLSLVSLLLPPVAAVINRRERDGARGAIALWYVIMLFTNAVAYAWMKLIDRTNNLIVTYVAMPFATGAVLWALAELQTRPLARTAVRICIPLIFVVAVPAVLCRGLTSQDFGSLASGHF